MERRIYPGFVEFFDVQVFCGKIIDHRQLSAMRGWAWRTANCRDAGRIIATRLMSGIVHAEAPKLITGLFALCNLIEKT